MEKPDDKPLDLDLNKPEEPGFDWAGETLIHEIPEKPPKSPEPKPEEQSPVSKEKREKIEFENVKRVVVKGSVAFALKTGNDIGLARDVDIFFVEDDPSSRKARNLGSDRPPQEEYSGISISNFENIEQAKDKLSPDEFSLIERFISSHGLENLSIHVVRAPESYVRNSALFADEPEVVLWDSYLELSGELLKPISKEEKDSLARKLGSILGEDDYLMAAAMKKQLVTAHELKLYQEEKLITGDMPHYLEPHNNSLAAVLRLVDLGRRFRIEVDDSILSNADYQAAEDDLQINIPSEDEERNFIEKPVPGSPSEGRGRSYLGRGRRRFDRSEPELIDIALLNVCKKKELTGLVKERYPNLAELITRIEAAGGIREFVKKVYGEGYLSRDSISLKDYKFTENENNLSPEEQRLTLNTWENAPYDFLGVFGGSFENFLNKFTQLRGRVSFEGESPAKVRELILTAQMESDLESDELETRRRGYSALDQLAGAYQKRGEKSAGSYQSAKQLVKDRIFKEKNPKLKKVAVRILTDLGRDGVDMTIVNDFAEMVKKESIGIKTKKSAKKEILSPEGMDILRGLFNMEHEDATRAVFELVANPAIDPRLKKLCLKNLLWKKAVFSHALSYHVKQDVELSSGDIRWEDYEALNRINKISSTAVKSDIKAFSESAFVRIRKDGKGVAEVNGELAPSLPSEFFLPLYQLFGDDPERMKIWDQFIGEIRSNKTKESFLYNIANILKYDRDLLVLVTDKIIYSPKATKEHIALAGRILKKIHSIVFFRETLRGRSSKQVPDNGSIKTLLAEAKAPSLLEVKLDETIISSLYEITGRGDLSSDRIQTIFNAWENPEPVFIFASQLAGRRDNGEKYKRSMDLMGEMLAHMDPPDLEDWKQWRYRNEDEFTPEQLKNLSSEQVEAYAEDEFVDLGEVLVGLLPSDKPGRIQEEITHALRHDWRESGDDALMYHARNLLSAVSREGPFDFESLAKEDLEDIEVNINLINSKVNLEEDLKSLERLPGQLENWQNNEVKKKEALIKMGFRGDETREEIEEKIRELKESQPDSKDIIILAGLKPAELPDKVKKFLECYGLPVNVDSEVLYDLKDDLTKTLNDINAAPALKVLSGELFGDNAEISPAQWQEAIRKLKVAQTILRLGSLTPQLIAFNKLSPGKKKATLKSSIDNLKRNFSGNTALLSVLERIEAIISEASHPIGKDHLAVVFTDNPLALLTIGKFPNGATSCQNYESGDTVLAAYMGDAYTKMCLLVDLNKLPGEINEELEKAEDSESKMKVFNKHTLAFLNASVGRRLTKIVQDIKEGKPKLFLEPVYTPLDKDSTARLMNAFAVTSLEPKLNMPIVRGGGTDEVYVAESRNKEQYEDGESGGPGGGGAGLGTKSGSYKMSAQPLQKKDYLLA